MKNEENMSKEKRTEAFQLKNARRKANSQLGTDLARDLRRLGLSTQIKTTIPCEYGEDIVEKEEIMGVAGAFGWATKDDWNARVPGTSGVER